MLLPLLIIATGFLVPPVLFGGATLYVAFNDKTACYKKNLSRHADSEDTNYATNSRQQNMKALLQSKMDAPQLAERPANHGMGMFKMPILDQKEPETYKKSIKHQRYEGNLRRNAPDPRTGFANRNFASTQDWPLKACERCNRLPCECIGKISDTFRFTSKILNDSDHRSVKEYLHKSNGLKTESANKKQSKKAIDAKKLNKNLMKQLRHLQKTYATNKSRKLEYSKVSNPESESNSAADEDSNANKMETSNSNLQTQNEIFAESQEEEKDWMNRDLITDESLSNEDWSTFIENPGLHARKHEEDARLARQQNVENARPHAQKNVENARLQAQENEEDSRLVRQQNVEDARLVRQQNVENARLQTQKNVENARLQAQKNVENARLQAQKNGEEASSETQQNEEESISENYQEDARQEALRKEEEAAFEKELLKEIRDREIELKAENATLSLEKMVRRMKEATIQVIQKVKASMPKVKGKFSDDQAQETKGYTLNNAKVSHTIESNKYEEGNIDLLPQRNDNSGNSTDTSEESYKRTLNQGSGWKAQLRNKFGGKAPLVSDRKEPALHYDRQNLACENSTTKNMKNEALADTRTCGTLRKKTVENTEQQNTGTAQSLKEKTLLHMHPQSGEEKEPQKRDDFIDAPATKQTSANENNIETTINATSKPKTNSLGSGIAIVTKNIAEQIIHGIKSTSNLVNCRLKKDKMKLHMDQNNNDLFGITEEDVVDGLSCKEPQYLNTRNDAIKKIKANTNENPKQQTCLDVHDYPETDQQSQSVNQIENRQSTNQKKFFSVTTNKILESLKKDNNKPYTGYKKARNVYNIGKVQKLDPATLARRDILDSNDETLIFNRHFKRPIGAQ